MTDHPISCKGLLLCKAAADSVKLLANGWAGSSATQQHVGHSLHCTPSS